MRPVRITAFPVCWLARGGTFADSKTIIWSTGRKTEPGDIQVFSVSATLGEYREFAHDVRRDAVHSIWKAVTAPEDDFADPEWPIQAKFKLLLRLDHPVPKGDLVRAKLLKGSWPRNSAGKFLRNFREIEKLATVLARRNPKQRKSIYEVLGLKP